VMPEGRKSQARRTSEVIMNGTAGPRALAKNLTPVAAALFGCNAKAPAPNVAQLNFPRFQKK